MLIYFNAFAPLAAPLHLRAVAVSPPAWPASPLARRAPRDEPINERDDRGAHERADPPHVPVCRTCPRRTAGPNQRAGFIAAPVSGPPMKMSAATARPMARPPIFGARGSIAVPNTATTQDHGQDRFEDDGRPRPDARLHGRRAERDWLPGRLGEDERAARRPASERRRRAGRATYIPARAGSIRPVSHTPNVTAGLKWPPGHGAERGDHHRQRQAVGEGHADRGPRCCRA